jgi:putative endonuclease
MEVRPFVRAEQKALLRIAACGRTISTGIPMKTLDTVTASLLERLLAKLDAASAKLGRARSHPSHLAVGIRGEEAAFFYLRRQGYIVTARSWRSHRYAGDIDLIGWDGDCLCFIEVKTRTTREVASAESAVDESKRKTLRKMARHYLRQLPAPPTIRFDVLAIYFEAGKQADLTLFKGAFGWSEAAVY